MARKPSIRIEKDSMGIVNVPQEAYYGASTMRAVVNFPISDLRFSRSFIKALGLIKLAASETNSELGLLDEKIGHAIRESAREVADGHFDNEFVVDVFQTGSGTSTNTNVNEVIANRASEILCGNRNKDVVHPNDHVNLGQSSNDVIPTALHLSAVIQIEKELIPALTELKSVLEKKALEFWPIIKTGRTHLQDATPIRLGQEFTGYAGQIEHSIKGLQHTQTILSEVAIGGTAVGTGVNTHPQFATRVCKLLSHEVGMTITESRNHFQAQSTLDSVVQCSSSLRTVAISIGKIANDIRWLASGPRAGLGELSIPEVQPGSSIMPGKVNPVIIESVLQVTAQVLGNDLTISLAGQGGYFELNTMMPVATFNLLQSITLISTSARNFASRCISDIAATNIGPDLVEQGLMLATALSPVIGYDKAADIAKTASLSGRTIREIAKEHTTLTDSQIDTLLNVQNMTQPGLDPRFPRI